MGPRLYGETGRADRVGMAATARIAHGRDMVDVDAEAKGSLRHSLGRSVVSGERFRF
jgi:hypothetical protein